MKSLTSVVFITAIASLGLAACGSHGIAPDPAGQTKQGSDSPLTGGPKQTPAPKAETPARLPTDGSRLKQIYALAEDGAVQPSERWFDSKRAEECSFRTVKSGGEIHNLCRPELGPSTISGNACGRIGPVGPGQPPPPPVFHYSDPACTVQVTPGFANGAAEASPGEPAPKYVYSGTSTSQLALSGPKLQEFCFKDASGCCVAATEGGTCTLEQEFWTKGQDVPASEFVEFRVLHD